nr:hypothetical protein [Chaphamaparvovirus sp.]
MANGFTILLWVRADTPLLNHTDDNDTRNRTMQALLGDASVLLGVRWSMDINITMLDGFPYAYGINTRFGISDKTLKTALGDLYEHVDFLRGSVNNTLDDLAKFRACKVKWSVPDQVTESTSGWEQREQPETLLSSKRKRF